MTNTIEQEMMTWNIQGGAIDNYDVTTRSPSGMEDIRQTVIRAGADIAVLVDAYAFDDYYGGGEHADKRMATSFGFRAGHYQRLDDERLNRHRGGGIGIALLSNAAVHESTSLDLGSRQGIRAIMNVGTYGLQVAAVYLDDVSEAKRQQQVRAMLAGLEPDMPTVIQGDFNMLRDSLKGANLSARVRDLGRRALTMGVRLAKPDSELDVAMRGMHQRSVYPLFAEAGFRDSDSKKRPTAPSKLPLFGIDYVLHNDGVAIENFRVAKHNPVSDHRAIHYRAVLPARTLLPA